SRHDGIQVVLDVHRDALPQGRTANLTVQGESGERYARMLFIVGTTDNPLSDRNLAYAKRLQERLEAMAPGVTRGVRVMQQATGGDLHERHLTVYVGDYAANTVGEAEASGRLLGRAVAELLREDG